MSAKGFGLERSRLSAALFAALLMPVAGAAFAQDAATAPQQDPNQDQTSQDQASSTTTTTTTKASTLDRVVVTGSLIPQTELETFRPVTVISAEDLKTRGFTDVADALQKSSFSTGGVQNGQTSASFTQGAETVSLFGLNPGYTKYLIDGRPLADYPALYNGSDAFNNISGIPVDLVERIEILPGGQSSLYGSDAIAGVINIILKKKLDGAVISARVGWYDDGGGKSTRVSVADGFQNADGRLNVLIGGQFEHRDPIWGYDRDITSHRYTEGTGPAVAPRDWLVFSPFTSYHFLDPANCANVAAGFGGTEAYQTRPGFGNYCGSFNSSGYRTLKNGKESGQFYAHTTYDLNDNMQFYGDVLYSNESTRYHVGSNYTFWATGADFGYYYDPRIPGDLLNLQRVFVPEDMGGYERSMNRDDSSSYSVNGGVRGTFGDSNWDYDLDLSRTQYKLTEHNFVRFKDAIDQYFIDHVLGPQQGLDPLYGAYPVFTPNYAAFYTLMSPADFDSFTGHVESRSKTYDNLIRGQLTNASLFSLPGGDAGLAIALEGGTQDWTYAPDARLLNGEIWGTTATAGAGHRKRYAVTGELRLPLFDPLTISLSGRYDKFDPTGAESVSKPTYSLGIEYRPFESLLFRGKYGTAFKAPTLPDQFQAPSGYYSFVADYYNCGLRGFDPANVDACPATYSNRQFFGTTQGSQALKPLTADVWSYGLVWAPTARFSIGADYNHFDIRNEVGPQSATSLTLTEYHCRNGDPGFDINSPTCQDAISKITRNGQGNITAIFTPKVNQAQQVLNVVTANMKYGVDVGAFGDLLFRVDYTNNLKQVYTAFEGDEGIDLLRRPGFSSDPKVRANASVTWRKDNWSSTLYADRIGRTPNYLATVYDSYSPCTPTSTPTNLCHLAGKLSAFTLFNASVSYKPTAAMEVSFLVNNLTNKQPPDDHTYPGSSDAPYNSSNFSPYGRSFYVEARWNFGTSEE